MGFDIDPAKRHPPPPKPASSSGGGGLLNVNALLALAGFVLLTSPWLSNEWHWLRGTGAYTCGWQGTATSARPTVLAVVDFFADNNRSSSYHRSWVNSRRSTGHYVATIKLASGREIETAISADQFYSLTIPSYVVCKDDQLSKFANEAEARAAGVPPPAQGQ